MNKKALSFIEVLISVAIIVILAIVGLAYKNSYDENKYNSKVIADTSSLKNSFLAYKQENGNLPNPGGNKNYYKKNSSYSHDENGAFGVHGFVTNEMISKKYLNYLPLDPRVNQFYAYGKTLDNNSFEIASILVDDGDYITKIEGNYDGQELVGLIREYNGPQFLYDQSTSNFPYNPEENKMTARIASYTGSVSINGETTDILAKVLVPGTIIETSSNSNAQIFYSDGSRSTLEENSKLEIKEMSYKNPDKEHNLLTSVKLFLENGTIWTKASRLNQNGSEFEVTTQDTTAAVRGTIFGVQRKNGKTNVNLQVGEIDLKDTNGNLIETITVLPGTAEIQRTIKNGVKQATVTPINFIDKENIFPSNLKLKIESIKENSGKQINIVNTFSKGKLFVDYTPFNCNANGKLLECMVGTIPENTETKFCNNISPENDISCTKEIKLGNLVFNKVNNIIPEDKYQENKTNLTATPASPSPTPGPTPSPSATPSATPSASPTYTPCNGSFTAGCTINLSGKKVQLLSQVSSSPTSHCGDSICGPCSKKRKIGLPPIFIFHRTHKYCTKVIDINGNRVLAEKRKCRPFRGCRRKKRNWNGYTFKEVH